MTPTSAPIALHLDTEAWLPVNYLDGRNANVSLGRLLTEAHLIERIDTDSPPGQACFLRIVTAIAYQALALNDTPHTVSSWRDTIGVLLAEGKFPADRIDAYFSTWHHRFDLFDAERPWRQDPRLRHENVAAKGVNTLIFSRNTGASDTMFSIYHDGNPGVASIALAVESMLTHQFYGSIGKCTARTPTGLKTASSNLTYVGPLRSRVSFNPVGRNFFETILAHLVKPVRFDDAIRNAVDLPGWENPDLPVSIGVKPFPVGSVSLLAGEHGHAILLDPAIRPDGIVQVERVRMTWAYNDKGDGNLLGQDPYTSVTTDKDTGKLRASTFDPTRVAWRDLPALLSSPVQNSPAGEYRQPKVMESLRTNLEALLPYLRIEVHGFAQHATQTNNHDWSTSSTPPVLLALNTEVEEGKELRQAIQDWVQTAELEAKVLTSALRQARRAAFQLGIKDKFAEIWDTQAKYAFWSQASTHFDVARAGTSHDFLASTENAAAILRRLTVTIYDDLSGAIRNPRGMAAVLKHRPYLLRRAA